MATPEALDDGIPVLTDVVDTRLPQLPPRPAARDAGPPSGFGPDGGFGHAGPGPLPAAALSDLAPAEPQAPPISGPPSLSEFGGPNEPPPGAAAPHPNSAEAFAARVEEAVLERLMGCLDPVLEARLKENLTDLLEKVLADMTAELKYSARGIIREAVAQAVADEIAAQRDSNP